MTIQDKEDSGPIIRTHPLIAAVFVDGGYQSVAHKQLVFREERKSLAKSAVAHKLEGIIWRHAFYCVALAPPRFMYNTASARCEKLSTAEQIFLVLAECVGPKFVAPGPALHDWSAMHVVLLL